MRLLTFYGGREDKDTFLCNKLVGFFFFLISFEIMEVIRAVQASLRDFILAFLPCRIVTLHGFHERESK